MNKFLIRIILILSLTQTFGQTLKYQKLEWDNYPPLPPSVNNSVQHGLAGAFSGIYKDVLIVAGGANFPDGLPWNGGKKVWYDDIYLLDLTNPTNWIVAKNLILPFPSAYGVSIEDEEGIILIGGCETEKCFFDVFLIQPDIQNKSVKIKNLPPLPKPLAFMTGSRIGDNIFIAGGQESMSNAAASNNFFYLDLSKRNDPQDFKWKELPSWPGSPRILPVSATQSNGTDNCFYLFSGRDVKSGSPTQLLDDGFRYNIAKSEWESLNIINIGNDTKCIMAGSAIKSGSDHILIFSGDKGNIFEKLEDITFQIDSESDINKKYSLTQEKIEILNNHPGFSKDVLAYHTITDTWMKVGEIPFEPSVTTNVLKYNDTMIIPSGEIKPGIRTAKVTKAKINYEGGFGLLNYIVLAVYLSALVFMGFYFSKREKTTDDFFKAGGRIPWWAAALSIFGTMLSAITFMAVPAKVYATDWSYYPLSASIIIVAPIIAIFVLPFYRRLNLTTAYEFLEMRFNLLVRLFGSTVFILFQLGRIGIVLLLPSLALSVITGIDIYLCIAVLGVLSITYTVLGGIEAVIWTDVIQVIVLFSGAVISLVIIFFSVEGGINTFIETATLDDKLHMFNFEFNLSQPTFWVIFIGGIFLNFISYGTDQTVIQRYLTTKDEKSAAKSIWANAIFPLISTFLFFAIGTALYVFYKTFPSELNIISTNTDSIYPWYIVSQLPNGISGILIAAIFSAAMSSLDSSMNSIATAFSTDFFKRFKPNTSDHSTLIIARYVTVIVGVLGTSFALLMASWDIKSLWDQFNVFLGLFIGGLGGVFLLGMFTKRANGIGALLGLITSAIILFIVKEHTNLNFMLYAAVGCCSAVITGYFFSLVFYKSKNKSVSF